MKGPSLNPFAVATAYRDEMRRMIAEKHEMEKAMDRAWVLVDTARGLIGLGKAHDLLGEALHELNVAQGVEPR